MARFIKLEMNKSYATVANAHKAVEKANISDECRYVVMRDEETGRYFPLFIGENCMQHMVQFKFHVAF